MSAAQELGDGLALEALRRAFDASFAAPTLVPEPTEDFLAITVGGTAHVVRLADVAAFAAAPRMVPLPGAPAGLLGVAGIRGVVIPVYELAALVGRTEQAREGRYVMVVGTEARVALSFGRFEGYRRVLRADVVRAVRSPELSSASTGEIVGTGDAARAVLDVARVLKIIEGRAASRRVTRE